MITAIAAKELDSDTIMITKSRRGVDAYVNGERIDFSVVEQQTFRNVTVVKRSRTSLSLRFSNGVLINVRVENGFISPIAVAVPATFHENTRGLLGVYNGNPSDDLSPSNRMSAPLSLSSSLEHIHFQFGLSCKCFL